MSNHIIALVFQHIEWTKQELLFKKALGSLSGRSEGHISSSADSLTDVIEHMVVDGESSNLLSNIEEVSLAITHLGLGPQVKNIWILGFICKF